MGRGGGRGGGMGGGMIQESISWVKIKLLVDFQPNSLLGSTPD